MEAFEPGIYEGYRRAILRIQQEINFGLLEDLKMHKRRFNIKEMQALLTCALDNRHELIENPFAFIRCNNDVRGGYEVWEEDKNRRRTLEHESIGRKVKL